ncbi:MAG: class I SAM-dependent methyltransferase [Chloroflexota bacterium]
MSEHGGQQFQVGQIDLELLARLAARPPRFTPHDAPFWDDPYIASQMLDAHLDPDTDAASRRPETIDRTVSWLMEALNLRPGSRLLDLGCGPGLYCQRFGERGVQVTGIDISAGSLAYAQSAATTAGLPIEYIQADYVTLDRPDEFDAITLIYYDFGVLPDPRRDALLRRVRRALRPDGVFAFDVKMPSHPRPPDGTSRWEVRPDGFWRPHPYLELSRAYWYSTEATELRQTIIVEPGGQTTVYRIWDQTYTPETLAQVLAAQGLEIVQLRADLAGTPIARTSTTLGIVARTASARRA